MLSREEALALLRQHTKSETLIKHALAVEAAMRGYARRFGEDENKWAITGLLHDIDFEGHPTPEEHPAVGAKMLEDMGFPADVVYAIKAHGDHLGLERRSLMDKTLYAVDEFTGFLIAVALVRPSKSLGDVDASAVKKKMKDKAFARAVDREEMVKSAADLGVPFEEHITVVATAMREIAAELGLNA